MTSPIQLAEEVLKRIGGWYLHDGEILSLNGKRNVAWLEGRGWGLLTAWKGEVEWLDNTFGKEYDIKFHFDNIVLNKAEELTTAIKLLEDGLK